MRMLLKPSPTPPPPQPLMPHHAQPLRRAGASTDTMEDKHASKPQPQGCLARTLDNLTWRDDDTAEERGRKRLFVVAILFSLLLNVINTLYGYNRGNDMSKVVGYVGIVAMSVSAIGMIITKRITRPQLVAVLISCSFTIAGSDLSVMVAGSSRMWPWFIVMIDILLVLRAPRWMSVAIITFACAYVFITQVELWLRFGLLDMPLLMNSEQRKVYCDCEKPPCTKSLLTSASEAAGNIAVFLMDVYFTRAFANRAEAEQQRVQAAVEVAQEVAGSLARFDLHRAEEVLARHSESLPPALVEGLSVQLANLNEYRPYLPQSVLPYARTHSRSSLSADPDTPPPLTAVDLGPVAPLSPFSFLSTPQHGSPPALNLALSIAPPPTTAATTDSHDSSSVHTLDSSLLASDRSHGDGAECSTPAPLPPLLAGVESDLLERDPSVPALACSEEGRLFDERKRAVSRLACFLSRQRISVLTVSLRRCSGDAAVAPQAADVAAGGGEADAAAATTPQSTATLSGDYVSVHTKFLEQVLRCVARSKGLVDTFVGDRVSASFNASRRCPQHSISALRTVKLLSKSVAATMDSSVSFGSAVASGSGSVGVLGTSEMRRPMVLGTVTTVSEQLERFAYILDLKAVCNKLCYMEASHDTEMRMLLHYAVIGQPFDDEPVGTGVYEVVADLVVADAKERGAGQLEWMYELEQCAGKKWEHYNDGAHLLMVKGLTFALDHLRVRELPDELMQQFLEAASRAKVINFEPRLYKTASSAKIMGDMTTPFRVRGDVE